LVAIDLDELQHKPLPGRSPRRLPVTDVVATLKARIEQLEAELAAEQQRSAGHRAYYEHERERADLLARSHEKLDIQLKNLRLHLQAGRQAAAPRTLRDWWRWLRATG
jgi:chromosome segregation ATPase